MTSIRKNINGDVVAAKKSGNIAKSKLHFIEADQYDDTQAFPAKTGQERGNIPLKNGEYWHSISAILDTVEMTWTGSVEEVATKITNETKFVLGGMDDNVFDLLEGGLGKGFYVVPEICLPDANVKYLLGNGCKPAKMVAFEGGSQKDKTGTTVTFRVECGELVSKYVGSITLQSPQTISVGTSFALTSNDTYQMASDTTGAEIATVSAITDADINRIITIKGGGGVDPMSIVDSGNIILNAGAAWVGDTGKQISFKILKTGGSAYSLVEVYGSRT